MEIVMSLRASDLIDAAELTLARYAEAHSGRVTQDARGNSVWEWHVDGDKYSTDITSTQMNRIIDPSTLELADETVKLRALNESWVYQSDRK